MTESLVTSRRIELTLEVAAATGLAGATLAATAWLPDVVADGSSAIQTIVPTRPGTPRIAFAWVARSTAGWVQGVPPMGGDPAFGNPMAWAFHFDDEDPEAVARDMGGAGPLPPWRSATVPSCAGLGTVPGVVASEAATITVPVFVGNGDRDVVPNPWTEPFAYRSSRDVTVVVCERMAHMHNVASTRVRWWERLHIWGDGVAATR